ncbi:MAG TPA: glycosyltransferase family 39 protein [Candidatus Kryptonia bacterium]|nr:glycosyltransferase family 39 protein [Candidatus Kryptonia bacterium]
MTHAEPVAVPDAGPSAEIPLWVTVLLAAAIVVAYTFSLGIGALAEPDEPRYAEIAREMLARHDWVTPTVNYVKYFEKPPLVYWLTMIVFRLFGMSDGVARIVPVASTLGTLALTGVVGRHAYDRWVAIVGVALLATSPLMFGMGQTLTLDPALTVCLTAALTCFWFGYHRPGRQPMLYRAMYIAIGLGVLVKGPVAIVLTGGIVAGFFVVQRDWRGVLRVVDPVGICLFALVALPWFVLVSLRNPEFLKFFVMDQHLKRFLAPEEHHEGIWFFLPFVFAGLMPWSLGLVMVWRQLPKRTPREWSAGTWFCSIWAIVVVGFFSLSASKLATYILPALPPLALLCARLLQQVLARETPFGLRLGWFFTAVGWVMLVGGSVAGLLRVDPMVPQLLPSLGAGGVVMVVTGSWLRRTHDSQRALAIALAGWSLLLCAAMAARDVTTSYRELGRVIRAQAQPSDLVVIYHHYIQGIPFYTQRRAVLVGGRGELAFGSEQGDQRDFFWREDDRLVDAWASPKRLFLVINRSELETLRPQLAPPPIEIAAEGKKVVVINHPL